MRPDLSYKVPGGRKGLLRHYRRGSCTNVATSEMVSKLSLVTTSHLNPYLVHWLDDGNEVIVTRQVQVRLKMRSFEDKVLCDVIPVDACHILLGRT